LPRLRCRTKNAGQTGKLATQQRQQRRSTAKPRSPNQKKGQPGEKNSNGDIKKNHEIPVPEEETAGGAAVMGEQVAE